MTRLSYMNRGCGSIRWVNLWLSSAQSAKWHFKARAINLHLRQRLDTPLVEQITTSNYLSFISQIQKDVNVWPWTSSLHGIKLFSLRFALGYSTAGLQQIQWWRKKIIRLKKLEKVDQFRTSDLRKRQSGHGDGWNEIPLTKVSRSDYSKPD